MSPQSPSGAEVRLVDVTPSDDRAFQAWYDDTDDCTLLSVRERNSLRLAFARHRLAEQERCAKVADAQAERDRINVAQLTGPGNDPQDEASHYLWSQQTAEAIATTIRSTTHDE